MLLMKDIKQSCCYLAASRHSVQNTFGTHLTQGGQLSGLGAEWTADKSEMSF